MGVHPTPVYLFNILCACSCNPRQGHVVNLRPSVMHILHSPLILSICLQLFN